MKSCPVSAELFHADRRAEGRTDGQTDRHDETNSRFRNFANVPNKQVIILTEQILNSTQSTFRAIDRLHGD